MPSGFSVKLEGFDEVIAKLDVKNLEQDITDELTAFGYDVERDAKQFAPVDEGFLRNSIAAVPGKLKVEVVVNCDYAAYVEFGTRKFAAAYVAVLPADWKAFAATFKGPDGGTFMELVLRIKQWAERTGKIPPEAAYAKALKIVREGTRAQPYLFPAFENNRPKLIERLRALLKNPK